MTEGNLEQKVMNEKTSSHNNFVSEEEKQRIIDLYEEAEGTGREASRILNKQGNYRSTPTILKIWKEAGLKTRARGSSHVEDFSERNKLISEGFSLEYIAKIEGILKTTVQLHIKNKNLYEIWLNALNQRREIIDIINNIALNKASEEGFSQTKAMEYHLSRKKHSKNILYEKLVEFFQAYENIEKETGRLPSLTELCKITDVNISSISKIMKKMNLPYFSNKKYHYFNDEQKKAIKNAEEVIYLSSYDIAYFLDISARGVKWHLKHDRTFSYLMLENKRIICRKASQIYEAKDIGFTIDEIKKYGKIKSYSYLEFLLKNRKKIELNIVKALQKMFPEREINTPYL